MNLKKYNKCTKVQLNLIIYYVKIRRHAKKGMPFKILVNKKMRLTVNYIKKDGGTVEEMRVALIGIVVENPEAVTQLNEILHQYRQYIIGRMGIPYPKRKVSIISVAVDAPGSVISALSGKLGMLDGVSAKTVYSKISENDDTETN